jgi:hypothetical protein
MQPRTVAEDFRFPNDVNHGEHFTSFNRSGALETEPGVSAILLRSNHFRLVEGF